MTEQEYQLITGLFDNLRRMHDLPKDAQADAAIRQQAAQTPDAAYWLAQRSLLLEQSLQQARSEIAQLQSQLHNQAPAPGPSSGSFLSSGLDTHFGRAPQTPASPAYSAAPAYGASYSGVPAGTPPDAPAEPAGWRDRWFGGTRAPAPMPAAPAAAPAGSGFLSQAAASAAGMAGGMLLFNSLSHMLGHPAHAATNSSNQLASDTDNNGLERLSQEAGRDHVGNAPAPNALLDDQASASRDADDSDSGDYSDDGGYFDDDNYG